MAEEQNVGLDDMDLWTIKHVMARTNLSESTIRRSVKSGELHSVKVGRSVRFAPEDVADWVRDLRGAAA